MRRFEGQLANTLGLPSYFHALARLELEDDGFVLWTTGTDGYAQEHTEEPLNEVTRVECWFVDGQQCITAIRPPGEQGWAWVGLGEDWGNPWHEDSLKGLAASIPAQTSLADIHPALHAAFEGVYSPDCSTGSIPQAAMT